MAELLLKIGTVGPAPAYQDGDIVVALTDRRIGQVHLDHLCHVFNYGLNKDGWRPLDTLAQKYRESTHQFRFERLDEKTVLRTNILTGAKEEFGEKNNKKKEHIYVTEYLARQLGHPGHCIFGDKGREVWYGGTIDTSVKTLDSFWPLVEDELHVKKADHILWPFSDHELKHFLALKVDDFGDDMAGKYVAPVYEARQDNLPLILLKKRQHSTAWKSLDLGVSITSVESKATKTDIRASKSFICSAIVIDKSAVSK
jgi:hypothetical protein